MPGALPLILLVEDEPDLREVITDFLEEDGARFRIEIAGNYDDGVVLLNASQPALLIADVLLPGGGDGHQLAEAARRLGVATLLISGRPEVIVEQEARGVPFLAKPFRLPELQWVIRTLMEGEPPAAELGPAAREREGYEALDPRPFHVAPPSAVASK